MQMAQHSELIAAEANNLIDLDAGRPARWGVWMVIAGFGGFLLWSCLAPLDAGVVATGTVKVTSNRKAVQHLSGGTVEAILVREGDVVKKGQEVVRLDALRAVAEQGALSAQYIVNKTVETAWKPNAMAAIRSPSTRPWSSTTAMTQGCWRPWTCNSACSTPAAPALPVN